jgi:hypothetical protein
MQANFKVTEVANGYIVDVEPMGVDSKLEDRKQFIATSLREVTLIISSVLTPIFKEAYEVDITGWKEPTPETITYTPVLSDTPVQTEDDLPF